MINIVLYNPEIPQNTGNIIRTCVCTGSALHLIEPLGFELDEKHLRRAGLDYISKVDLHRYPNWETFFQQHKDKRFVYITRYGHQPFSSFTFDDVNEDVFIVFGKESTGIPKSILSPNQQHCARLPMIPSERSLNLSNCVAICTYEILRQWDYPGLSKEEVIKGKDWLDHD